MNVVTRRLRRRGLRTSLDTIQLDILQVIYHGRHPS
jgi:hypothetical protein